MPAVTLDFKSSVHLIPCAREAFVASSPNLVLNSGPGSDAPPDPWQVASVSGPLLRAGHGVLDSLGGSSRDRQIVAVVLFVLSG